MPSTAAAREGGSPAPACGRGRAPRGTPALGHRPRESWDASSSLVPARPQASSRSATCLQASPPGCQARGGVETSVSISQRITPRPLGEETIKTEWKEGVNRGRVWLVSRERGGVLLPGAVSQTRDFHREPPTERQSEGGLGPLGGVRRVRLQSGETLRPIWSLLGLPFKSPSVTRAQSSPAGSHVTPVPGTASGRDECGCLWPRQARPDGELATAERGSRKPQR